MSAEKETVKKHVFFISRAMTSCVLIRSIMIIFPISLFRSHTCSQGASYRYPLAKASFPSRSLLPYLHWIKQPSAAKQPL